MDNLLRAFFYRDQQTRIELFVSFFWVFNFSDIKFDAPLPCSVHGNLPPEYKDKNLFICDKCPLLFIDQKSFNAHIVNVHNEKKYVKKKYSKGSYECPDCRKTFSSGQNYLEHIETKHKKNTPYKCEDCHRSYGTLWKLKSTDLYSLFVCL